MNSKMLVGLDFETYCALSLPEVGLARYVAHPSFMPTLASVATDQGTTTIEFPGESKLTRDYLRSQLDGYTLTAHNAGFERAVLNWLGMPKRKIIDSAVTAAVAGADRHLAGAAQQLMQQGKLDEDRSLLNLFAKKQKGQVSDEFDVDLITANPDKWNQYKLYCERDAMLSRGIVIDWYGNSRLFARENRFAELTLAMNEAGWPVDIEAVEAMRDRYEENLDQIQHNFAVTVDPGLNIASHVQVKKWCLDRGIRSQSFDKQNVERLVTRLEKLPSLTEGQSEVLELLRVKQALGGSSLKKLETILATAHEGRVYDQYVHAGAPQSLRTSGRSIQMQNLPRLAHVRDMATLHDPFDGWSNEELAGNIRQLFTASQPDGQLIVADFASIESRALAYQAGEMWKTDAYARGEDVYKAQAMKIFKLPDINIVTKEQRTTGKVGELSCGYGAGPVAVKDFAAKMHVEMSEGEAGKLVRDWRDANPKTVDYWDKLGRALFEAVSENQIVSVSAAHGITIKFVPSDTPASLVDQAPDAQSIRMQMWKDGFLVMVRRFHGCYLRGHNIGYYKPSSLKGGKPWKKTYVDPKTKRQRYYELYGGKLAGIITQSMCREIFFEALLGLSNTFARWDNVTIIGQFHDEVVVDWVPGCASMQQVMTTLEAAMSTSKTFPSLPMDVEVKHDYRYTK
jgi:DNA polymerase bacteriophage-type